MNFPTRGRRDRQDAIPNKLRSGEHGNTKQVGQLVNPVIPRVTSHQRVAT